MIMSCKIAHSKYTFALEEAKKTQVENENEKKHKLIDEEIMQVKAQENGGFRIHKPVK